MKPSPPLTAPTPNLPKASTPARQKPEPLKHTDDQASIFARIEAQDTAPSKELTNEEKIKRLECEEWMKESALAGCKSTFMMGFALMQMRDMHLYRDTHETVYDLAKDKYNVKRARVSQVIGFAKDVIEIRKHLIASMPEKTEKEVENLLPCSEAHTRALGGLDNLGKTNVWIDVIAGKPAEQVTVDYIKEVRNQKFPTTKRTKKAAAQESVDPVHVVASVTDGKLEILTEPAKPQDGFKIELTVKPGSVKEMKAALRRLAGKELSKALNKAA